VVVVLIVAAWGLYRWAAPARSDAHVPAPVEQALPDTPTVPKGAPNQAAVKPAQPATQASSAKATEQPRSRRNANTGSLPPLTQPLAGKLMADLEDKISQGDTDAAVQLWYDLDQCNDVLSDSTKRHVEWLQQPNNPLGPQRANAMLQGRASLFNNCTGITAEQLGSRYQWLKQAAAQGNAQAQLFYAIAGTDAFGGQDEAMKDPAVWDEYKNTAMNYLTGLSEQCDPYALNFLKVQFGRSGLYVEKNNAKSLFYAEVGMLASNNGKINLNTSDPYVANAVSSLSQADMNAVANDAGSFFASNCQ
jgi:hypothetical protein